MQCTCLLPSGISPLLCLGTTGHEHWLGNSHSQDSQASVYLVPVRGSATDGPSLVGLSTPWENRAPPRASGEAALCGHRAGTRRGKEARAEASPVSPFHPAQPRCYPLYTLNVLSAWSHRDGIQQDAALGNGCHRSGCWEETDLEQHSGSEDGRAPDVITPRAGMPPQGGPPAHGTARGLGKTSGCGPQWGTQR